MKSDNTTNLIDKNFDEILAEGFNRYAKYIIQDRALPELRDGLKPVQRRILYAMYKLNLLHDSQFKKSARTVGDVLGKYHPHGDSSIYEALIRMGQDWKNNITEIDIHGNKGSIDDDPAAAMRYTEARLSLYGEELLNHIEKKIYPFINNFDDTETEPTILPSLLPNLLINGASGIAAGYATSIPTFNTTELLNVIINKIKKPNLSLQEILKIMPGPDFPTAGNLFNQNEIKKIYLDGEGKITIRSSYRILEGNKKEKTKIIITDIPYETIKSDIVAQIETLITDNKLPGINNVIDATDKNGIAIELEADDNEIDVTSIMQFLYKKTQLQVNFNANMIAIYNKKPVKIGVLKYLDFYIEAAIEIIIKVEKYLLKQDEERYEIVLGLIKAISILDAVITCIRASKDKQDSINNLVQKFYFTAKQAEAIVNLRLYRLTNTDMKLLQEEKEDLNKKIANHYLILKNKSEQENVLIAQLKQYIKTFGYARKSKIANDEVLEKNEISIRDLLNERPVYVVITNNNQIKYVSKLENDWNKFNLVNYKTENDYIKFIIPSNVKNKLIFFTNQGRMVGIDVFKLQETKWKDNGEDLLTKLHLPTHEVIVSCLNLEDILASNTKNLLFYTKMGKAKQINKTELANKKDIRLANCINLDDTDELLGVKIINEKDEEILSFSKNGYVLKFNLNAIPIVSLKAKGINIMKLNKNDELKEVISLEVENEIKLALFLHNYVKTLNPNEIEISKRNLVGKNLVDNKKNENILMIFKKDKDNLYYAYDKLFNFVFLGNLSIENTINWNKLDKTLNFVNVIKEI